MGARRVARLLVCASVAVGCRGDADGLLEGAGTVARADAYAGAVAERDSAGVRIIETPGAAASAPLALQVEPEPFFRVGLVDGPAPYVFSEIRGVVGLANREVLVVDGASGQLRVFDVDGVFQRSEGGRGRGPGEFESAFLTVVATPTSDSIWIFDGGRFTRYDERAGDPQVVRLRMPPGSGVPLGLTGHHVLTSLITLGLSPSTVGPYRNPRAIRWIDLETGEVRGEAHDWSGPGMLRAPGHSWVLPFQVLAPPVAVGTEGFYMVESATPQIRSYSPDQ
jgi:hypothetical protein